MKQLILSLSFLTTLGSFIPAAKADWDDGPHCYGGEYRRERREYREYCPPRPVYYEPRIYSAPCPERAYRYRYEDRPRDYDCRPHSLFRFFFGD